MILKNGGNNAQVHLIIKIYQHALSNQFKL